MESIIIRPKNKEEREKILSFLKEIKSPFTKVKEEKKSKTNKEIEVFLHNAQKNASEIFSKYL